MQATHRVSPTDLSRPLNERGLAGLLRVVHVARLVWRGAVERLRSERRLQAVADMDHRMLRDIGAPDWMIDRAAARRESQRWDRAELRCADRADRLGGLR